jgi:ubiquinone/menaquinone biosynthesis C-methylase UbiE/biotin operon repressor
LPTTPSILKALRAAADPIRLRMLLLLQREELSVAEVQEIIGKGQSHVSTSLAQLKQAGLVLDRRTGKNAFYRLNPALQNNGTAPLVCLLEQASAELPDAEHDRQALDLVVRKRQDRMRRYFDELAGRFGRAYVPGRSWKGLAEALLKLMPRMVIADLGAGEGTISQLLAQRAERVIAIDNSEKMVEFGADLARRNGIANLEYRLGDIESVPIPDATIDLAFFSQALHHAQHPGRALAEAWRILKPGGRIAILDLMQHSFEEAREMYADLWLGFSELDVRRYLERAGFRNIDTTVVNREPEPPHFETMLATAEKPAARINSPPAG